MSNVNVDTPSTSQNDNDIYEVDKILDVHVDIEGKRKFLVSWKGYDEFEDSWEPEEHLETAQEAIREFMESKNGGASMAEKGKQKVRRRRKRTYDDFIGQRLDDLQQESSKDLALENPEVHVAINSDSVDANSIPSLYTPKIEPEISFEDFDCTFISTSDPLTSYPSREASVPSTSHTTPIMTSDFIISGHLTIKELQQKVDFVGLSMTVEEIEKMSKEELAEFKEKNDLTPHQKYVIETLRRRYYFREKNRADFRSGKWVPRSKKEREEGRRKRLKRRTSKRDQRLRSEPDVDPEVQATKAVKKAISRGIPADLIISGYISRKELQQKVDLSEIPLTVEEIELMPRDKYRRYVQQNELTPEQHYVIKTIRYRHRCRVNVQFYKQMTKGKNRESFKAMQRWKRMISHEKTRIKQEPQDDQGISAELIITGTLTKEELQQRVEFVGLPFTVEQIKNMSRDEYTAYKNFENPTKEQIYVMSTIRRAPLYEGSKRRRRGGERVPRGSYGIDSTGIPPELLISGRLSRVELQSRINMVNLPLTVDEIEEMPRCDFFNYQVKNSLTKEQIYVLRTIRKRHKLKLTMRKQLRSTIQDHEVPPEFVMTGRLPQEEVQRRIDMVSLPFTVKEIQEMSRDMYLSYLGKNEITKEQKYVLETIRKRHRNKVRIYRMRIKQAQKDAIKKEALEVKDIKEEVEKIPQELVIFGKMTEEDVQKRVDLVKLPFSVKEIEEMQTGQYISYLWRAQLTYEQKYVLKRVRKRYFRRLQYLKQLQMTSIRGNETEQDLEKSTLTPVSLELVISGKLPLEEPQKLIDLVNLPFTVQEIEEMPRYDYINYLYKTALTRNQKYVLKTIRKRHQYNVQAHRQHIKKAQRLWAKRKAIEKRKIKKEVDEEIPKELVISGKMTTEELQKRIDSVRLPFTVDEIEQMPREEYLNYLYKYELMREQQYVFTRIRKRYKLKIQDRKKNAIKKKKNRIRAPILAPRQEIPSEFLISGLVPREELKKKVELAQLPFSVEEIEAMPSDYYRSYRLKADLTKEQQYVLRTIRRRHMKKQLMWKIRKRQSDGIRERLSPIRANEIPHETIISGFLTREELQQKVDLVKLPFTVEEIERMPSLDYKNWTAQNSPTNEQRYVLKTIRQQYFNRRSVHQSDSRSRICQKEKEPYEIPQELIMFGPLTREELQQRVDLVQLPLAIEEIEAMPNEDYRAYRLKAGLTKEQQYVLSNIRSRYIARKNWPKKYKKKKRQMYLAASFNDEESTNSNDPPSKVYLKDILTSINSRSEDGAEMTPLAITPECIIHGKLLDKEVQQRVSFVGLPFSVQEIEEMSMKDYWDYRSKVDLTKEQQYVLSTIRKRYRVRMLARKKTEARKELNPQKPSKPQPTNATLKDSSGISESVAISWSSSREELQQKIALVNLPFTVQQIENMAAKEYKNYRVKNSLTKEQIHVLSTIRTLHMWKMKQQQELQTPATNPCPSQDIRPQEVSSESPEIPHELVVSDPLSLEDLQHRIDLVRLPTTVQAIEEMPNDRFASYLMNLNEHQSYMVKRIRERYVLKMRARKYLLEKNDNSERTTTLNRNFPLPTKTSLTKYQKCVVCGDLSCGQHFGVFTCIWCMAFFYLVLNGKDSMNNIEQCDNQCIIHRLTRASCKYCWMKKCFDAGMTESGDSNGRIIVDVNHSTNTGRISFRAGQEVTEPTLKSPAPITNSTPNSTPVKLVKIEVEKFIAEIEVPVENVNVSSSTVANQSSSSSQSSIPRQVSSGKPSYFIIPVGSQYARLQNPAHCPSTVANNSTVMPTNAQGSVPILPLVKPSLSSNDLPDRASSSSQIPSSSQVPIHGAVYKVYRLVKGTNGQLQLEPDTNANQKL